MIKMLVINQQFKKDGRLNLASILQREISYYTHHQLMKKLYGCIPLLSLLEIIPCNKLDEINRNLLKCRRKVIQIKNKNQNKLKTMKKNKH